MLYLDTSALLKLYLREQGSEWVHEQVAAQSDPLPVWELQEAELTNALRLKVFWRDITATQAEGNWRISALAKSAANMSFLTSIERPSWSASANSPATASKSAPAPWM